MTNKSDRRGFLRAAMGAPLLASARALGRGRPVAPKHTDIRIERVTYQYDEYVLRTPLKFGGRVVTSSTSRMERWIRASSTAWD
jgi:hypothetical protein